MEIVLARNWWSLVLRGVLALILGFVAFAWPGITLGALVLLFGAYALIDGVMAIVGAWRASRAHERWGVLVLEGLVGIAAAAVTILWPAITALALVYLIAAWAVVTGVFELAAAIRLRKIITGEWMLALTGIASVIFGILALIIPLAGALAIAFMFGVYEVIFGVLLISLGFRLRSWTRTHAPRTTIPLTAH
jgi:uncharacterized membrane protein HdeD (DUF308 family)